jgi:hypothetical protein
MKEKVRPGGILKWTAILFLCLGSTAAGSSAGMESSSNDRADTWHFMYADLDYTTLSADMQLNALGFPVLCYKAADSPAEGLRYAEYDGSVWIETSIDPGFMSGTLCQLRLSPEGYPMIIYRDSDPDDFKYAWYDGMTWNIETFWTEAGNGLDAAVDDAGGLHVCFSNTFSENCIYYGFRDQSGWTIEEIGQATQWPVAITLDENSDPHTAWDRDDWIINKWRDGGTWYADSFNIGNADAINLAFGPDGALHAGVHEDQLFHCLRTPSGWEIETVDDIDGFEGDMEVGEDGTVHMVYDDWFYRDLYYARKDSSGWYIEVVSWNGSCGWSPSMYLDGFDNPHIFHSRNTSSEIIWWGPDTLSIEEEAFQGRYGSYISAATNPLTASSSVQLQISNPGTYTLSLYDITGRLERVLLDGYLDEGECTIALDPADLSEGTYFLRLTGSDTSCRRSVVVLR